VLLAELLAEVEIAAFWLLLLAMLLLPLLELQMLFAWLLLALARLLSLLLEWQLLMLLQLLLLSLAELPSLLAELHSLLLGCNCYLFDFWCCWYCCCRFFHFHYPGLPRMFLPFSPLPVGWALQPCVAHAEDVYTRSQCARLLRDTLPVLRQEACSSRTKIGKQRGGSVSAPMLCVSGLFLLNHQAGGNLYIQLSQYCRSIHSAYLSRLVRYTAKIYKFSFLQCEYCDHRVANRSNLRSGYHPFLPSLYVCGK
jgi:hypothetical protein